MSTVPHILPALLTTIMKPHQKIGVRFIWRHIYKVPGLCVCTMCTQSGSRPTLSLPSHVAHPTQGDGCVLADYMGLGKTYQLLCCIWAFMRSFNPDDGTFRGTKCESAMSGRAGSARRAHELQKAAKRAKRKQERAHKRGAGGAAAAGAGAGAAGGAATTQDNAGPRPRCTNCTQRQVVCLSDAPPLSLLSPQLVDPRCLCWPPPLLFATGKQSAPNSMTVSCCVR